MHCQFRKYTKRLIFSFLTLLMLVGGLNWFVDPYSIYNSPKIEGFNVLKPELSSHVRLRMALAARVVKPKAIILGSSRATNIDASHKGWSYEPVFNLAIGGANIYEMLRYFQHYHNVQPLKQVLLTLDFFSFSTLNSNKADFDETLFSISYDGRHPFLYNNYVIATLLSTDAVISSLITVRQQKSTYDNPANTAELELKARGGHRAYFLATANEYATDHYLPGGYQFDRIDSDYSPFTYYRRILQISYRDGIDLRLAISPSHVRQWEVLAAAGLWPKFEEWKRTLTAINEQEAHRFGKIPFPLWDFSVYNELTTEAVPVLGDMETVMHWYWDSSHYNRALGDLMLDRIFSYHESGRVVPDDFGVLMNSENIDIDSHLQKIRADRQYYRDTHPDDIAEINEVFSKLPK